MTDLLTVRDPSARVNAMYGTKQIPETYIIDRQGMLRRKFVSAQNWTSPEIIDYLNSFAQKRVPNLTLDNLPEEFAEFSNNLSTFIRDFRDFSRSLEETQRRISGSANGGLQEAASFLQPSRISSSET